jgi:uncharacterized protein YoxC
MVVQRIIDQLDRVDHHLAAHQVHVPEIVHHVPEIVHHVPEIVHHVPEIVHHVPEIVHHVPEIVHHVPEIAQSSAQVVAVAMIAPAQLAMFQMVAQSVTHVDSAQLQWSATLRVYVHESSNQIFLSM